jgi:uncharacterized membrane protein YphA (DoxX/SURF4 family)
MAAVHHRNATALAALRIFVGIFFLLFGEYKVFGTEFTLHGGFEESIRGFLEQGAYPWMAPVLRHVVLPHAHLWAFLTAYGELLIGLGLIFGVLTRLASIWRYFGASLDSSVFAGCFAAFLVGEPELRWSLAQRLRRRKGAAHA